MYLPSYINFIYTQKRTRINHDYSQLIVIKLNKSTFLKMKKKKTHVVILLKYIAGKREN